MNLTFKIHVRWGKLCVKTMALAMAQKPGKVRVTLAGRQLPADFTFADGRLKVRLNTATTFPAGQTLEVQAEL